MNLETYNILNHRSALIAHGLHNIQRINRLLRFHQGQSCVHKNQDSRSTDAGRAVDDDRRIRGANALMNGSRWRQIARRLAVLVILPFPVQSTVLVSVFELHLLQRRFDLLKQCRVACESNLLGEGEEKLRIGWHAVI